MRRKEFCTAKKKRSHSIPKFPVECTFGMFHLTLAWIIYYEIDKNNNLIINSSTKKGLQLKIKL